MRLHAAGVAVVVASCSAPARVRRQRPWPDLPDAFRQHGAALADIEGEADGMLGRSERDALRRLAVHTDRRVAGHQLDERSSLSSKRSARSLAMDAGITAVAPPQ